jgi:outer membrane protein OmpA-like peptidoglycan-associated protein
MFLQSDDEQLGLVLGLLAVVVIGVLALAMGAALYRPPVVAAPGGASVPPAARPVSVLASAAAAPAPVGLSAQATSDAASVMVEYGVVKFYFASGSANLAGGAADALGGVTQAAKGGKKVLVAGFHDSKGNALANADLARRRSLAVQKALLALGVPDRQIILQKAQQTAGSGIDAEARRVEITLQ